MSQPGLLEEDSPAGPAPDASSAESPAHWKVHIFSLKTPGVFGAERALGSRYFDYEASGHVGRKASRATPS